MNSKEVRRLIQDVYTNGSEVVPTEDLIDLLEDYIVCKETLKSIVESAQPLVLYEN